MPADDLYVLSSPLAWVLWFIALAVAMYFARSPAQRAILSLAHALHMRCGWRHARSC